MTPDRRKQLKREGKAEVERRSRARKAESEALLPDMMAALNHPGTLPVDLSSLSPDQASRAKRELWIVTERPVLHREQLHREFVPLPDTANKWSNHPFSYLLCKACGSAVPQHPKRRLFAKAYCQCRNVLQLQLLGHHRIRVEKRLLAMPVAIFGRATPTSAA
jgi:hypothetical protein